MWRYHRLFTQRRRLGHTRQQIQGIGIEYPRLVCRKTDGQTLLSPGRAPQPRPHHQRISLLHQRAQLRHVRQTVHHDLRMPRQQGRDMFRCGRHTNLARTRVQRRLGRQHDCATHPGATTYQHQVPKAPLVSRPNTRRKTVLPALRQQVFQGRRHAVRQGINQGRK